MNKSQQTTPRTTTPRKKFTQEEDNKLRDLVGKYGNSKWEMIAKEMPGRSGRQCRGRYQNYLVPGFVSGQWSDEEDQLILKLYMLHGSQWTRMAQCFEGRSPGSIKNRWNFYVSKNISNLKATNNNYFPTSLINDNIVNINKVNHINNFVNEIIVNNCNPLKKVELQENINNVNIVASAQISDCASTDEDASRDEREKKIIQNIDDSFFEFEFDNNMFDEYFSAI